MTHTPQLDPSQNSTQTKETSPLGKPPKQIVVELDKYIIGQYEAKKAVALTLRNRQRRLQLEPEIRREVLPKNILMVGSTGVGKTEIARRMARLVNAPFIKVEASKFTEVGYVGRDVEAIIRDLTEIAVDMVRRELRETVTEVAKKNTETELMKALFPNINEEIDSATYDKFLTQLREGKLEEKEIEVEVPEQNSMVDIMPMHMSESSEFNPGNFLSKLFPKRTKQRKLSVKEARKILEQEEAEKLIDMDKASETAIDRVQSSGVVFLDEIDKIASGGGNGGGKSPNVSREGVQRDLLPIVEGSTVKTRYGFVQTEHILFIAAGAFHVSKPSDLIPELQGRFPVRVDLESLSQEDFKRILVEPENALTRQYIALLNTENVTLEFTPDAIDEIARIAYEINDFAENIGARRLHSVMEKLLEKISFDAPEKTGETVQITPQYIQEQLFEFIERQDLSRYIL